MVEAQAANTRGQVFAAAVLLGWALSAAQPAAGQEPIDGVCDDSVRNGCAAGTANDEAFPDQPNAYLWRCDGLHGGRNSDKCFLPRRVDGVCDDSVRNGCAAGRANDAAFPDYSTVYVWRCDGLNGGTNSSKCAKFVPVDGVCDETRRNGCAAGTANDAVFPNYPTVYVWRCDGQFGGEDSEKCSKFTAVDGGWSDWSACSATACGAAGTQTRTCSDPVPAHDGRQCLKLDGTRGASETRACTGAAAVDGGWSAWSACSASACGAAGTQTRTCDNPAPGCGGSSCSGPSSRACAGGDARDGVWETGAWGSWSACSGSICDRSRSRSVTCAPAACGGAACDASNKPAATQTSACPSPAWQTGSWSAWSACSATACGAAGQQTRTRTVSCPCGTACAGTEPTSTETQPCTGSNPRDGVWETGEWGPWGTCDSSTCEQEKTRSVTCALPGCGGAACDEDSKPSPTETQSCSNPPNPAWQEGPWSDWTACSATACGVPGHQIRTRTVSCPCNSRACPTLNKPFERETQSCTGNTPEDGECDIAGGGCLAGDKVGDTGRTWQCEGRCGGSTVDCREPPCSGKTLEWGSGCSATATTTLSRASVNLTNAASCRGGSATFTCNAGTWGSATNATCTVTPAVAGRCGTMTTADCVAGTREDMADTTLLLRWRCVGSCNGATANCIRLKMLTVSISAASTSRGQGTATATVSGGTPPYTYRWRVDGAEASSSNGARLTFSYRSRAAPTPIEFTVTVTDSVGVGGSTEYSWGPPPGG